MIKYYNLMGDLMFFDILSIFNLRFLVGFLKNGIFPLKLSQEEEERYISELFDIKTHDKARDKLISHNLRLVAHIAKKYDKCDEDNDDLISIGTIGLIKAVDTYSLDKKVKLATYAARCIENEILMTLRTDKKRSKDVSFFEAIGTDKDGSEITLIDVIPSSETPISEDLDHRHMLDSLNQYIGVLDDRELEIISLRYGLNNFEEHTQKEIAKKYRISRSYVSRIEKRALVKLLQEFKKHQNSN